MINKDFWRGRKVYLTGHTGFKGSWTTLWLLEMGAEVTGYSLAPDTKPSLFEVSGLAKDIRSEIGDIRDFSKFSASLKNAKPEIVIHMAAQPLVRLSYRHPIETYETNVMGTVNLMQGLREIPSLRAAVIVTTDKCYENPELNVPFKEDDPLGGHDPYSSSKACTEIVTSAMRRSFFSASKAGIGTARAGNVIGGGDWAADRLVPDIVRSLQQKETVTVRNPDSVRPWQHVLEPIGGYLTLAEKLFNNGPEYAEAWNFGPMPESACPVHKIANKMTSLWDGRTEWKVDSKIKRLHEAQFLQLSTAKAESRLGWRPALTLDETLEWTCDWYRKFQTEPESARKLCQTQIQHYSSKLKGS